MAPIITPRPQPTDIFSKNLHRRQGCRMNFYYDHHYPINKNAATSAHAKFLELHPKAGNHLFHTQDADKQRGLFAFAYEITNFDLDSII